MAPTKCRNGSSNLLAPYREQPRSTRIVVAYPRPAFSATERTDHAPISFDQQVQVSQGHRSCRCKEIAYRSHGGGGLELVEPAIESAFSRPKPCCASLKNALSILPVRCFSLGPVTTKQTEARDQLSIRNLPVHAFDSRAQGLVE